jgi:hypothetical protein
MPNRSKLDILPVKFIALDSSLIGNIAHDFFSSKKHNREKANNFLESLTVHGFVPILCWHQFEELIKHTDRDVVSNRIAFLRSLPLVAWISSANNQAGLGSIVDILAFEAKVAYEFPTFSVEQVRDHVLSTIIRVGAGEHAITPYIDIWEDLRPPLWQQERRAREIVAISRAKLNDISEDKAADFVHGRIRPLDEAMLRLQAQQSLLANDIKNRGDKRIPDANSVASKFYQEVAEENITFYPGRSRPGLAYLQKLDIDEEDIHPDTLMGELMELAEFRKKLHVAHQYINVPWTELKRSVTPNRIPSWLIENSLKKHGQDLPERKGSELNDNHLACLSAYVDLSYVDKRTKENFRRALEKNTNLGKIIKRIEKASNYDQVRHDLDKLPVL